MPRPRQEESTAPVLRLCLLGGFRIESDGRGAVAPTWRRPGAPAVLKLLALTAPDHRLPRERILGQLWPDAPREAGLNRLRVALHEVRGALEPGRAARVPSAYLLTEGEFLLLNPRSVAVDVDTVLDRARLARRAGDVGLLRESISALAVPLLPDEFDTPWIEQRRRELGGLRRALLLDLADRLATDGGPREAEDLLTAELAAAPAEEDLIGRLMRLQTDDARPASALETYRSGREALAAELGAVPGDVVEQLRRQAAAALGDMPGAPRQDLLPHILRVEPAVPLVGRRRVLELACSEQGPPLTVVSGEAGVGKTRLVAEAARAAAAAGVTVLWATDRETAGPRPFGALTDALDELLAGLAPAERAALGGAYPYLSALLPSMAAVAPRAEHGWSPDRFSPFQAVAGLLDRLASGQRLLVVCDDLHEAPLETLRLMHHLVRTARRRWRFLATSRDDGSRPNGELDRMLSSLSRERLVSRVALMCLAQDETERLVAALLDDGEAERIGPRVHELSRGNPLLITELVDAHRQVGRLPAPASLTPDGSVPDRISALAAERLSRLSAPIRNTAAVLACANGPSPVEELHHAVAGSFDPPLSEPALLDALEAGRTAGLLEEREVLLAGALVPAYAFRHPVLRLACYQGISAARRRLVHRRLAEAVDRHRPERVEDLVVHHLRAGDDRRAVPVLRRAAARAEGLYANDAADTYYRELVTRLDAYGEPGGEPRLHWGTVLRRLARHEEAAAVLADAVGALELAGRGDLSAQAVAELAEVHGRMGAPQQGLRLLEEHRIPGDRAFPDATLATMWLVRARLLFMSGRHEEHRHAAEQAASAGARVGDPAARARTVSEAQVARSLGLLCAGRYREAAQAARTAVAVAEPAGNLTQLSAALSCLAELAENEGRLSDALGLRRRARDVAERSGDPAATAFEMAAIARLHVFAGDSATAVRRAREAVSEARAADATWYLVYPLLSLAEALLAAGEQQEAGRNLRLARELADAAEDGQARHAAGTLTAQLRLAQADPHEALRELAAVDGEPGALAPQRGRAAVVRAEALLAHGDAEGAELLARRTARRAGRATERLVEADALFVAGRARHALGDEAAAARALSRARSLAASLPYPALSARVLAAAPPRSTDGPLSSGATPPPPPSP